MKIPPWLTAQVATLAALGAVSFLLVRQCGVADAAKAQAAKSDEAVKLKADDLTIATEGNLNRDAQIVALQAQIKASTGNSGTPAIVIHGTTGPVQVSDPAVLAPGLVAGGMAAKVGGNTQGAGTSPSLPQAARDSGAGTPSPAPGPALSAGDETEIRVEIVGVETRGGNLAMSGRGSLWRVSPNPGQIPLSSPGDKVADGSVPLHLDVAVPSPQVPQARGRGWGAGAAIVLSRSGYGLGPAVAAPPLRLWSWQAEPSAALTLSRGGEWAAAGQIIIRRSR